MLVTLENVREIVKAGIVLWGPQPGGMKPEKTTVVSTHYDLAAPLVVVSMGRRGKETKIRLHPRQLVGMCTEKSEAEEEGAE